MRYCLTSEAHKGDFDKLMERLFIPCKRSRAFFKPMKLGRSSVHVFVRIHKHSIHVIIISTLLCVTFGNEILTRAQ